MSEEKKSFGASASAARDGATAGPTSSSSTTAGATAPLKEARNALIHQLYVRQDFEECAELIEKTLKETKGQAEYAVYVKGLLKRHNGEIQESLQLFQAATVLNPSNVNNLKQVARSLLLLGRHKQALEVYDEAQKMSEDDWEIHHNRGLCFLQTKRYPEAVQAFQQANSAQRHDATYLQLGKAYTEQGDFKSAIEVYEEALELSPENTELLTTLGLMYLRMGESLKAFDHLGNSLAHNPRNPKTILAAGSIIQDNNDLDVALTKYRVAAVHTPNSAQLWNNIGMCFFGKQRYVAAISCLKRALYLDPFEWIIAFNLGLVHLNTQQYASAFHYLSNAINMKPDYATSYMYLAIALKYLEDPDNACAAYEKALEMDGNDHLCRLNYAILLQQVGQREKAVFQFQQFSQLWSRLDEDTKTATPDVAAQKAQLEKLLDAPQLGGGAVPSN